MKFNRKITDEVIEKKIIDVYHFVHSDYKPDWHVGHDFIIEKKKKLAYVSGYNSDFFPVSTLLEELKDKGKIIPNQDYLVEIKVKLTKLEDME